MDKKQLNMKPQRKPRAIVNDRFVALFKKLEDEGRIQKGAHGGQNRKWVAQKLNTEVHVLNDYIKGNRDIPIIRALHFCDLFAIDRQWITGYIPRLGAEEVYQSDINPIKGLFGKMTLQYSNIPLRARPASGAVDDVGDIAESLQAYEFPGLGSQVYGFTIAGDSMEPKFHEGDMVLSTEVDRWEDVNGKDFYVVSTAKGLYLKQISKLYNEMGDLASFNLLSLNELYAPFMVNVEDVRMILKVRKRITDQI